MKSIVARAALGACILTLPASFGLRAEDAVKGYDDAASTLKELIEKAELNIRKVDGLIEERKVTERNIVRDEKARAAIQRGNELYAAGDLEEAKKAWNEALAITKNEEMKRYLAEEERRAERKAAEERAARDLRMKQLDADGIALFGEGRLEEAEGKFRELLSLDADNRSAGEYLENRIPALRRERQQKAEREKNARAAFERGNEYKASGNMKAARDAWKETLSLTSDTALQAMAAGGIRDADGQLAALRVKIQGLQAEGVILFEKDSLEEAEDRFREVLSLEGTNLQAMNYFEVKIPARKTELARLAMQEEKAKAALLSGSKFYDAAQKERAMAVWQTGLQLAQQESTRAAITARIRKAEDQAAADNVARMARMEQIKMNGAALFSKDALDESEALFGELLALNAGDPDAQQYITTLIPDRRNELARLAAVEHQAETVAGGAEKLFLAGDYSGAIVGWQQAISLSGIPETKAACVGRIQTAEEKLRQQEIARRAHREQLAIEGVALFNQHSIDKAEAKFREVLLLDGENQIARQYIDTRIPARKAELARLAEIEGKAMTALEQGSKLYDSGDYLGAKTLWQEALGTAQQPATKAAITERIAKADGEQASLEAAITALQSEAFSLFTADSLGASEAKFLKLLTLDGENQNAKYYLETSIPARKGELARLAAQEDKAKAGLASGNKLYTAGQKSEAMAAWQSALPLALKEATRTAISTRIREAEAEAAAEQAARLARIEQLQNDGVTLFRQDSINESEAKFKELVNLDAQNKTATYYLGSRIPGRKAELARIAAAEEKAKATFEGGNKLYAAGDYAGAKSAWQEALSVAVEPATKTTITQRISSADAEQVAIQSKVDALQSEAAALFNADNLTASEAKFREVLALKPTNLQAMDYYEVQIPARKAELERRAAVELKAETAAEGAEKLFLAGDYTGALVGWQQAVNQTETPESRIAYTGRMDVAREKQREKEAALQGRIEQLESEGIALFQADSLEASGAKFHELQAIDAQNQNAKHYLETAIPARKGELARLAAQEDKAKAGLASGNKLYAAGQKSEAMAAWQSALPLALKEATRTAISTRIREAEAEAAAEQAAKLARIEQLQNDGVTLFRQDSINESEAKFKELVNLDAQNKTATYYLGNRIPGRKAELARIAAAEEKAKATFEGGNKLYAAGDYAGAKSAWQEALSVAVEPATKTTITQRISSADAEQVAIQSKVDALQSEAAALFNADNLTASEAKFREVLALKPTNLQAMDYYEVQIPARKAELERRAAVELKAETAAEGAEKLFLAGDYTGALVGWQQAVNQTETPESRIAYMGRMDDAREKQREKEAALQGRIEQLQSEGIALFQADSLEASVAKFHELQAIDAQNQNAKHYLETSIPARKGELARLAAQEDKAKAGLASGNKLYTAGQKSEAMAAWQSALPLALKEATRTAISTRIREAEAEAAAEQAAKMARIEQLQNDGVTLFRQDSINESEAKFKELVNLDAQNKTATYYLGSRIPGRKAELARIAAAEEKAKATFEGGNKLYAAGDYAGAKSAWQEALSVAVEPATKTTITQRISSADAEQVAIQSKVDALQSEAAALFNADNLTASEAKFREVLALKPTNLQAMDYYEVQIPARKAELERRAAVELKAETAAEGAEKLFLAGDYTGALVGWQQAVNQTETPESRIAYMGRMDDAREKQREKEAALQGRIEQLQSEGIALFQADSLEASVAKFHELQAIDAQNQNAKYYLETSIPARKGELARLAAQEDKAKAGLASGNKLYTAGQKSEAMAAWQSALPLALKEATRTAISTRIREAEAEAAAEQAAKMARIEQLQNDGVTLFRQDSINESEAKFKELVNLDAQNKTATYYLGSRIPGRKAELARIAAAEEKAKATFEGGNKLYAAGDYAGAKSAWQEALSVAVEPATKTTITQRISSADAEQVAIQSKVDALQSEAAALFNADNLTASEAKFREVLALKPTNLQAMDYYEVQIPARKAELERRAAVELKAETAAEGAEKLFLAGDYTGALVGWQQAVNQTETPESRIAYTGRMDVAREKQREKEAALQGRIEQLESEGIALFQADSLEASGAKFHELQAIDAQNQNAKYYLETSIPARKGELARLAAQEDKAKAGLASGNKLYTAGQKSEAMAAWQSALPLALKEATRTAISTRIREAEAEAAAEQAAKLARIEQLQNDGVTLFRQDSINESEAKFKELVNLDAQNKTATYYLGNRIPGRKAELARIAAAEEKAKATFEGGNKLYAAGDYAGAKSAWQEALSVAVEPATKTTITQRISSADAEQVAIQSKVDALQSEAAALFNADNLTASEAKFREVLALKPTNLQAMDYYEVQIPARKAELERRAAVELKAETAAEGAEKLFLAGDYTGALVGWQQAVNQTETPESRIAYMGRMDDAREKQREKEAALQGRIEQLQSEGIALFQADSLEASGAKFHELQAIDAQNQNAKHYLETSIPARKGELARLAAQEDKAKAGLASGNKLYAAGQKSEAMAAWQSALPLALKEATRTAISTRIREAEAEAAAEQAAKLARIEQLQNDGVTLFRQDSINESEAKFKELVILDAQNKTATYYLGSRIPGRKAELARIAAAEEKAKATFEGGNKLYAAGDYAGAKSAWQEALSVAVEPATKTTITQRISSADAEQVAIQSKVDALQSEAAALFNADNLTASEAKFRELLALKPTNLQAMDYYEVQIPARKAELVRIAEAEGKAGTEFKRGNVLYAGGDYAAAKIVWQEALNTAVKPETKASITDWMNKAEAEQAALQSRIGFLQREGSTLFAEDRLEESAAIFGELRSLKPSDPYANEYIEVKIPARKAALAKAAELEAEAKAAFVSGNSLYDAGNRAEAGEAWKKALGLAQSSETQDAVNARIARAAEQKQREAAALRIKVEGLCQEGSALFQADRLNEAAVKFNEVLVLDAAHQVAGQYLETSIPERKALLQRRREATKLAEVAMERGNQLYASGDYEGAKVAWMEALDITATAKQ